MYFFQLSLTDKTREPPFPLNNKSLNLQNTLIYDILFHLHKADKLGVTSIFHLTVIQVNEGLKHLHYFI